MKVYKKANQRLYFLRKLKDVKMDRTVMDLFYKSVIQSVVNFCIICWFGNLTVHDKKKLNRIVKSAKRLGCSDVVAFEQLYEMSLVKKADNILEDEDHPLYHYYRFLPLGLDLTQLTQNK